MIKKNNKNTEKVNQSNLQTARDVLGAEIVNLQLLSKQLDDKNFNKNFLQILSILENCKGRVLVSGVGKSGLIAKKISAIFSSISVASFFIHPTEAIHGDLGCIRKDDVLLAISCSGNTIELQDIVKYCNKNNITTASITCKKGSWLEKNTKINLSLNMKNEAIIGFPIPTTSSILTLAICDALTACLVKNKKLTPKRYIETHCGGAIGSKK